MVEGVAVDNAGDVCIAGSDVVVVVALSTFPNISIVEVTMMVRAVAVASTVIVCVVVSKLEVVRSVYMIGYMVSVFA